MRVKLMPKVPPMKAEVKIQGVWPVDLSSAVCKIGVDRCRLRFYSEQLSYTTALNSVHCCR